MSRANHRRDKHPNWEDFLNSEVIALCRQVGRRPPKRGTKEWKELASAFVASVRPEAMKKTVRELRPDGIHKAWGYVRVSTLDQVEGESLDAQEAAVKNYWQRELESKGVLWGGIIREEGESASKKHLLQREKGRKVLTICLPGDYLIFPIFDRAFRNMLDLEQMRPAFKNAGIIWRVIDLPFDPDTPEGIMVSQAAAMVAQFESALRGKRTKMAMDKMKADGKLIARPRYGFKIVNDSDGSHTVPNFEERRIMLMIDALYRLCPNWNEVSRRLYKKLTGKDPKSGCYKDWPFETRSWSADKCRKAHRTLLRIIEEEGDWWIEPTKRGELK